MTPEFQPMGRALLILGVVIAVAGLLILLGPNVLWLGRLPGDISIRRDHFSFYFPVTSCLLASLVISVMLWIVGRFR